MAGFEIDQWGASVALVLPLARLRIGATGALAVRSTLLRGVHNKARAVVVHHDAAPEALGTIRQGAAIASEAALGSGTAVVVGPAAGDGVGSAAAGSAGIGT